MIAFGEEVSRKQDRVIDIDFLYVTHPTYLDVSNFNEEVRNLALLKLQRVQGSWLYEKSQITKNSVDSYLNVLENNRNKDWKENITDFWDMTDLIDNKRKQKFKDYIPDVYEMIKNDK